MKNWKCHRGAANPKNTLFSSGSGSGSLASSFFMVKLSKISTKLKSIKPTRETMGINLAPKISLGAAP